MCSKLTRWGGQQSATVTKIQHIIFIVRHKFGSIQNKSDWELRNGEYTNVIYECYSSMQKIWSFLPPSSPLSSFCTDPERVMSTILRCQLRMWWSGFHHDRSKTMRAQWPKVRDERFSSKWWIASCGCCWWLLAVLIRLMTMGLLSEWWWCDNVMEILNDAAVEGWRQNNGVQIKAFPLCTNKSPRWIYNTNESFGALMHDYVYYGQ